MRIATWNVNNQVGTKTFRPEAAAAVCALDADVLVLTEYYPQAYHEDFVAELTSRGWSHQILSRESTEKTNRTLIAARIALEADPLGLPDFDQQLPANLVAAFIPSGPLRILGIRVPYYETKDPRLAQSWEWLEAAGAELQNSASLIIGDLNVHVGSTLRGGDVFSRMLQNGWTRVQPTGSGSYFRKDGKWNEIDHVLISAKCKVNDAEYITDVGDIHFAGNSTALSDHAALVVDCEATST